MRPQAIELFAGGGGFRLGLEPVFETVLAIEKDPQIAEVYASNFYKPNIEVADITNICFKKYAGIDLIVGGPPCQDYSYANTLNSYKQSNRGQLGLEMLRAIAEARPKQFILENVTGFKDSKVWQILKTRCLELGYKITANIIKCEDYGIPQTRHRFIAIGTRTNASPQLPIPTHDKTAGLLFQQYKSWHEAIADLELHPHPLAPFQVKAITPQIEEAIATGPVLIPRLGYNNKDRLLYRRATDPAYTVRAFGQKGGHWHKFNVVIEGHSYLADTRALARWQTFPDSYELPTDNLLAGKILGNAIPPELVKLLHRNR